MASGGIVFIDTEIAPGDKRDVKSAPRVLDIGAVKEDGSEFHANSLPGFAGFIHGCEYICGHNILNHDLKYLDKEVRDSGAEHFIDTLYLSPLLFPKKPYHKLVKDDKLVTDERSNPLNDAKKARDLFYDEIAAFNALDDHLQQIYAGLLAEPAEFRGFFRFINCCANIKSDPVGTAQLIRETFDGRICTNAPLARLAEKYPIELAYALALVNVVKYESVTPPWVLKTYPRVENILHYLRNRKCASCAYCDESLDETKALQRYFHFDGFRSYGGEPLQHNAVKAASDGKSILVVFPTGGGKSVTFQLPALMSGANEKGLTVVISPLQSLMKDQTDTLELQHNITGAVTINGLLDPLERAEALERVENGSASILYISPESLRSKSIETLLLKRNVVRFVIDEAHCFSTWGQDFRVDYLYIGDFIRSLQNKKDMPQNIPVSCFTATAKQKVITDISEYFRDKLKLELEVFRASSARPNLRYHILPKDDNAEKLNVIRQLLLDADGPVIIYAARVSTVIKLAAQLCSAGFPAVPYHGQMDKKIRVANQDAFMRGEVGVIVATTAFGMGVDKKDVCMVIHFDISASLEDYVQESGRAGRDESIQAECYVLYGEEDLDKHFMLLNQTKLTYKEVQQIWRALKQLMGYRDSASQSALEIARAAGWDDTVNDLETRVRTAISALEQSGFVRRGQNMPRIYADSILVRTADEAKARIDESSRFDDKTRVQAIRIIKNLISAKRKAGAASANASASASASANANSSASASANASANSNSNAYAGDEDGETYVDYISDKLGIVKEDVIRVIGLLREERILADAKDLIAYIRKGARQRTSEMVLSDHRNIENFLCGYLDENEKTYNIKEMNEALQVVYPDTSMKQLNTILNYYDIKRLIKRTPEPNKNHVTLRPYLRLPAIGAISSKRCRIAEVIIKYLYSKTADAGGGSSSGDIAVEFSVLELKDEFAHNLFGETAETDEIEDALYYLLKIGAMSIDGGFLVIYNAMRIDRLEKNNRTTYSKNHYNQLDEFYQNKRQQIHIVGEYAKRLINDYSEAMTFVDDYFIMDYAMFLQKYFKGRTGEISRNITPSKFRQLFGELSAAQLKIINDKNSRNIVVTAGPGSGKTKLLTHKLASLYIMEDVKHEQMLMLTFSRAAATEFKKRLMKLIGNAANFIQIATFHSFCFDLLGKVGDLDKSTDIIDQAVERIKSGGVDISRITRTVLVIDEAQDMSASEYALVKALMKINDELRVIAVGDDDQNIYEFRGSDSAFFASLLNEPGAKQYELLENFRSNANIVGFANSFATGIHGRMKHNPIISHSKENGGISIVKLRSTNVEIPVVNAVLASPPRGSVCIATRTNAEALNIVGLLTKNGLTARLIQANTGFNLMDLVELRTFCAEINSADEGYTIDDDVWENAKSALNRQFSGSEDLPRVFRLIGDFEATHNNTKYKSDLTQFIRESKLEDFISDSDCAVLVSTIHQTKGREFDNVFLAYSGSHTMDAPTKRAVYVALTRAKKNLHIFSSNDCFNRIAAEDVVRTTDDTDYPAPSHICMHLTHRDVRLGYFSYRQREIDSLLSGQPLTIAETGCFSGDVQVLKFSASYVSQLESLKAKGYSPVGASVRHIVFWQGEEMDKEIKIILPTVELAR